MEQFKRTKVIPLVCNPNDETTNGIFLKDRNWYHLYITSDDTIKEGDYVIEDIGGVVYGPIDKESIVENPQKIIATTEIGLGEIPNSVPGFNFPDKIGLPQPSQSFIEVFVREYNKGNVITDVLVEMHCIEEFEPIGHAGGVYSDTKLKVNPKDNTINIRVGVEMK